MNNFASYFPYLAFLAPIALFWNQSKTFLKNVFRLVWRTDIISFGLKESVIQSLPSKYIQIGHRTYLVDSFFEKKTGERAHKVFYGSSIRIYFVKLLFPVFVFCKQERLYISYCPFYFNSKGLLRVVEKNKSTNSTSGFVIYKIIGGDKEPNTNNYNNGNSGFLYGVDRAIEEFVDIFQSKPKLVSGTIKDYEPHKENLDFHKYVFTQEGKQFVDVYTKWLKAYGWYNKNNIRHYRGTLLYGRPGTGKSELVIKTAEKCAVPLIIIDLASFSSNNQFQKEIKKYQFPGAIYLFEDIDCVFNGRENIRKATTETGVTFDFFINLLSGAGAIKDAFVVITTNNIDVLDPALIRPGRIDQIIELKSLNMEEKEEMCRRLLEKNYDSILEDGANDSTAEFENRVVTECLNRYWN